MRFLTALRSPGAGGFAVFTLVFFFKRSDDPVDARDTALVCRKFCADGLREAHVGVDAMVVFGYLLERSGEGLEELERSKHRQQQGREAMVFRKYFVSVPKYRRFDH